MQVCSRPPEPNASPLPIIVTFMLPSLQTSSEAGRHQSTPPLGCITFAILAATSIRDNCGAFAACRLAPAGTYDITYGIFTNCLAVNAELANSVNSLIGILQGG
jgi:hypothetical protein